MRGLTAFLLSWVAGFVSAAEVSIEPAGNWQVRVTRDGAAVTLAVPASGRVTVTDERMGPLPVYDPKKAEYARGAKLAGVRACECSVRFALDPATLVVRTSPGGAAFVRGKDYEIEPTWGCVGRLEGGAIGAASSVYVSYAYGEMRLDAVVLDADKKIALRVGEPHVSIPQLPALAVGEERLATVWITPRLARLTETNLFPVLEAAFPEQPRTKPSVAEARLPKTFAKLNAGGRVVVLAWGDSVTDAGYLPHPEQNRWQEQFVRRLRQRFPRADIALVTRAWGGRNSDSFRNEPPGSPHNYREQVLALKPDLIVSEFVNDAGFNEAAVRQRYGRIRDEFREIGAEWIVLTPHYVRGDWMGLASEKNIDDDPRPYVKALRVFAVENGIALADCSLRYGRLWRRGIPYSTLLMNNINHPNPFGMSLFADALMALFPE